MTKTPFIYYVIYCIFLLGPVVFLSAAPFINLYLIDVLILLATLLVIFRVTSKTDVFKVNMRLFRIFILIIAGYLISSMGAINMPASLIALAQYCVVFVLLILVNQLMNHEEHFFLLIKLYLIGVSIAIITSFSVYFEVISLSNTTTWVAGRFCGIWGNPNAMAKQMYLFISILLSYLIFFKSAEYYLKIISPALFAAAFYLILLSASFGGIIFLAICLSLVLLFYIKAHFFKSILTVFVFIVCLVPILIYLSNAFSVLELLPDRFVTRLLMANSIDEAGSATDKYSQIISGIVIFLNSPLIGVGLENGIYHNVASLEYNSIERSFHSFFISVLVEGGLLAFLGFLFLFIFFYKQKSYRNDIDTVRLFMLITFAISLIISNNIYDRYLWIPFAVLVMSSRSSPRLG